MLLIPVPNDGMLTSSSPLQDKVGLSVCSPQKSAPQSFLHLYLDLPFTCSSGHPFCLFIHEFIQLIVHYSVSWSRLKLAVPPSSFDTTWIGAWECWLMYRGTFHKATFLSDEASWEGEELGAPGVMAMAQDQGGGGVVLMELGKWRDICHSDVFA